ncbi:hypothetical protein ABK040_000918 [Willaertia magna]
MGYHKLFFKDFNQNEISGKSEQLDIIITQEYKKINQHIIKQMHGKYIDHWRIEIKEYNPNINNNNLENNNLNTNTELLNKKLHSLQFNNNETIFYLIDKQIFNISNNFKDIIIDKLKRYIEYNKLYIDGNYYQCNDFIIRIGLLTIGLKKRGILFDIEYNSCSHCYILDNNLIKEFYLNLINNMENINDINHVTLDYSEYQLSHAFYSNAHHLVQYIRLFMDCNILKSIL